MLSLTNYMVAYDRETGEIEVGPWPDKTGWSKRLPSTDGCCFSERRQFTLSQRLLMVFIDFHTTVVGAGIDPIKAHREFLKIDEFAEHVAPDLVGEDNLADLEKRSAQSGFRNQLS